MCIPANKMKTKEFKVEVKRARIKCKPENEAEFPLAFCIGINDKGGTISIGGKVYKEVEVDWQY